MFENVVTHSLRIDVQGLGCPRTLARAACCWHTLPAVSGYTAPSSGFVAASVVCLGWPFLPRLPGSTCLVTFTLSIDWDM